MATLKLRVHVLEHPGAHFFYVFLFRDSSSQNKEFFVVFVCFFDGVVILNRSYI